MKKHESRRGLNLAMYGKASGKKRAKVMARKGKRGTRRSGRC